METCRVKKGTTYPLGECDLFLHHLTRTKKSLDMFQFRPLRSRSVQRQQRTSLNPTEGFSTRKSCMRSF